MFKGLDICSAMCYSKNVLIIKRLIWDAWNISHIARHRVDPGEVEAICNGNPVVLQGQKKGRLVLIGKTEEGRALGVVLESKGKEQYYPVTAYDADVHDTKLYNRLRGGDNNETDKK